MWGQETQPLSCQGHPGKLPTCTGRGIRQRGTPGCSMLRPAWGKRHAQPATPCPHVPARTRAASRPDLQHVEAAGGQGINAHLGVALVCVELLHQFRRRRGCRRERQGRAGEWERASNAVCSPSLQAHTPLASQARRAGAANQRRPALIVATSCMFLYHLSIHPCPHSLRSSITHSSPTAPPPAPRKNRWQQTLTCARLVRACRQHIIQVLPQLILCHTVQVERRGGAGGAASLQRREHTLGRIGELAAQRDRQHGGKLTWLHTFLPPCTQSTSADCQARS